MKLDIAVEAGKAYVGDLMLCVGAGTTWNQASNEVFGTNVKLTKDMLIIAPEDDRDQGVKTTIDPSGMKITDQQTGTESYRGIRCERSKCPEGGLGWTGVFWKNQHDPYRSA